MSPMLKKVENAGIKAIKQKRKPYKITTDDFFQNGKTVRALFSKLINNPEPERIAIIPSVSYGIANVVKNIKRRTGEILIVTDQFPSNVYPWSELDSAKIRIIDSKDIHNRGENWNRNILDSINDQTIVVAIGHVHWADGTRFDLQAIRSKLDDVNGLLIVDGTQSVGALPFDVEMIRPDALICSGYKWLMGPYSIGLAYYGKVFDEGTPIEENWINRINSDDFAGLVEYEENYRPYAQRYNVGEQSNFILIPMLVEALKQVLKWSPEGIQEYCNQLVNPFLEEVKDLGLSIEENTSYRSNHLFGIHCESQTMIDAFRESFKKHRVSVSVRGKAIRVSPHVYNDELDVRKLLNALKEGIFVKKTT
jgi:selenocysteine lyase/cysteine desulfurase